jgi:hypothetical protein
MEVRHHLAAVKTPDESTVDGTPIVSFQPRFEEAFSHNGSTWRVKNFLHHGAKVKAGMWIRLTYDPYDCKPEEVAKVISSTQHKNSPAFAPDYRIVVERDEHPGERRNLDFSDGAFEEVERVEEQPR